MYFSSGLYGLKIELEPENENSKKKRKTKKNDLPVNNKSKSNGANETVLASNAGDPQSRIIQDFSDKEPVISSTQVEPPPSSKKKKKHKKNKADTIITDMSSEMSAIDSFNASEEVLRENGVHEFSNPHKKKKKKHKRNDESDGSAITPCVGEVHTNESDSGVASDRKKRKRKLELEQTSDINVNKSTDIVAKKKLKKSEKKSS